MKRGMWDGRVSEKVICGGEVKEMGQKIDC